MAILLTKVPTNLTEYPNSFKRQGAFPLEAYSVFATYEEAENYAQNSKIAYVGQPLAVTALKDDKIEVAYYVIGDRAGKLVELGTSANIDGLNKRVQEIEKFFATEDGETINSLLDELVELQKWISDHLDELKQYKEEIQQQFNKVGEDLEKETERANKADEELYRALGEEVDRAEKAEQTLQKNIEAEARQRGDLSAELLRRIDEEIKIRSEKDAALDKLIVAETERANAEDKKLIGLIEAETSRANAADEELYQTIENLTEEDIHLKSDLYTYVNIGKITGASDTSRKKIADKGASLKTVFNAIFGTRQDKKPTITNNASLTATEGTKTYGGGEYGSSVTETTVTINFTLANTGTTNYGYKVGETSYKGNRTFYYPILKQENADLVITLPTGQTAEVVTENSLVKTVDNVIYCNFVNKSVSIKISLPADTVETSEQTRYNTISAAVSLGVPQDANGNTITAFLTYLESEGEPAQETAPAPSNQQGGSKTDTAGPYKINKGYIPYTYCLSSELPATLPTTNRTEKQPTSITVSGGSDSTYLYIFVPTGKSDIKSMSASGFAVPFNKAAASKTYAVNNGKETTYKVFKTEGSVKADTFIIG